jgi:putative protein kinase ArgK-like GTPase of G3E family
VASRSQIASLRKLEQAGSDLVVIETVGGKKTVVAISYDPDPAKVHSAKLNGRTLRWKGFAARIPLDGGND